MLAVTVLAILIYGGFKLVYPEPHQVMSWVVAHQVIVIDAGHGGRDPGAVGPGGTLEKDVTLAIAKRLELILRQAGAQVIMIRSEDKDFSGTGKTGTLKREDLLKRLETVKNSNPDLYLNIQANSFGTRWTGAQVFYDPRLKENERLAKCIQRKFRERFTNNKREAKELETFMLRNVEVPGVMIEVGFISNPQEEKLLNDPVYQDKIAWTIFMGVAGYLAGEK